MASADWCPQGLPPELDGNLVFSARKTKAFVQVVSTWLLVGLELQCPVLAGIPRAKHSQPLKSLCAAPESISASWHLLLHITSNLDLLMAETNIEALCRMALSLPREPMLTLCSCCSPAPRKTEELELLYSKKGGFGLQKDKDWGTVFLHC